MNVLSKDAQNIWALLRHRRGVAGAISAGAIARAIGLTSGAQVRQIIADEYDAFPAAIGGCSAGLCVVAPDDPNAAEFANHYECRLVHHAGEIYERKRKFSAKMAGMGFVRNSAGDWYKPRPESLFDMTTTQPHYR